MNYKVLYRKYRPDNFENIIGQDYIIKTLKNSIINNNISHAYIFSGPRGTGKTTTAKVFAKAINCLNPENGSPCGKCEFCTNFHDNPDIIEIDAASNNGVDEIRALIENIKITPTNGKYKVYIIDEVHMLTISAFNALLLTLEEPPAHSIFILATTNVENVPITILSRCQRFDFQKIKVDDIVKRLTEICKIENIAVDDEALIEIAYLSEGGLRDALSLLDQLSKGNEHITLELIESEIKTVSNKSINDIIDFIENNKVNELLNLLNEFRNRAVDYKLLIKKLIDIISKKAKEIKLTGHYNRLKFEDYKTLILNLSNSLTQINVNVDSFTILEMMLLEFCDIDLEVKNNQSSLDESTADVVIKDEIKLPDDELVSIRINNCFYGAKKNYLEESRKNLEEYLQLNINGKIKAILEDSTIVAASDKNLILTCNNDHNVLSANKMLKDIESSIKKETGKDYKIIFLTNEKWLEEKQQYIKNLKNKKAYSYIEEKTEDEKEILNDVFDLSKVEII